ncbi:MAG: hypothetical protein MUC96_22585 [Myxococcaceae bacterium]|jgi:hypothetical protein|nr:hypothetical protein [Myxococcaceae bacterium]
METRDGFELVYREGHFGRLFDALSLPFELGIMALGGLTFVATLAGLVQAQQLPDGGEALLLLGAGALAWWGGSTSYQVLGDVLRTPLLHEARAAEVRMTKVRGLRGGLMDAWVLVAGGHRFEVMQPPRRLRTAIRPGQRVRVVQRRGSGAVHEVWVRR